MKNCTHCAYAEWRRTSSGKLSPTGDGECRYPWKMPALPRAFYWVGKRAPDPCGGQINRRRELPDHCAYFKREMLNEELPRGHAPHGGSNE